MIIEVRDGGFAYDKNVSILKDINFKVEEKTIVSILGPNGVGKTTLLKCMIGLKNWTCGQTLIDDEDLKNVNQKYVWQNISYVAQAKNSSFSYSVLDMVLLGRNVYLKTFSTPKKKDIEIAKECLAEVGYYHLKNRFCNELSGGELQMVLIARALATEPKVLVLDEPESGLDFRNQLIILEMIEKLCYKNGISSIINTHYPDHALKISNMALMINKNLDSIFGKVKEIIVEENLEKYFNVQVAVKDLHVEKQIFKHVIPLKII